MARSTDTLGGALALTVEALRRDARRLATAPGARRSIRAYLDSQPAPKLQLGCGANLLPGWLNTDRGAHAAGATYLDAARPFSVPTGSFEHVFCEHLIEHLDRERGAAMLTECARVLRPGGRIRVSTPDLTVIAKLVEAGGGGDEIAARYVHWCAEGFLPDANGDRPALVINQLFHGWGHRFLYDHDTLAQALVAAGFEHVSRHPYGRSDDPELDGIDSHADEDNLEMVAFETLVLEADRRALRPSA
ncbi:MAG: methyltransferase domain-containing protein [Thermoleophilaceae bacterium]|nr:methyltransferase domain-containing protein [Thermoleophilaceae bacterium]